MKKRICTISFNNIPLTIASKLAALERKIITNLSNNKTSVRQ